MDPLSLCAGAFLGLVSFKTITTLYKILPYLLPTSKRLLNGEDQCIILSGATDGIGAEYAKWLVQHNYKVLALGRSQQKLEKIQSINPQKIKSFLLDFTQLQLSHERIGHVWTAMQSQLMINNDNLKIAGIINCVGLAHFSPYQRLPLQSILKLNKTNINSLHFLLQLQYRHILQNTQTQSPFFINISSTAALHPEPYSSVYSATKGYITNLISAINQQRIPFTALDIRPWYVTTKMVGYLKTWDAVEPKLIVEGSFKLLGKRQTGSGCLKHELLEEFSWLVRKLIQGRREEMMKKARRIEQLRSKRK